MNCRISDLRNKDVISIKDGARLGYVCDVEIDTCTAQLCAIVIYGRAKLFGLLGREDDCVICWDEIEVIGKDTILVNCKCESNCKHKRGSILDGILGYN